MVLFEWVPNMKMSRLNNCRLFSIHPCCATALTHLLKFPLEQPISFQFKFPITSFSLMNTVLLKFRQGTNNWLGASPGFRGEKETPKVFQHSLCVCNYINLSGKGNPSLVLGETTRIVKVSLHDM